MAQDRARLFPPAPSHRQWIAACASVSRVVGGVRAGSAGLRGCSQPRLALSCADLDGLLLWRSCTGRGFPPRAWRPRRPAGRWVVLGGADTSWCTPRTVRRRSGLCQVRQRQWYGKETVNRVKPSWSTFRPEGACQGVGDGRCRRTRGSGLVHPAPGPSEFDAAAPDGCEDLSAARCTLIRYPARRVLAALG